MSSSVNIIDVSEATFEQDVIQKSFEKPVVVDFWAAWCGPCRMLGPILERLANEPDSGFILAKLDVDQNPNISMRYQVQGIPAVKAFRNGQVAGEFVGAQPEPRVRQFLKQIAPSQAEQTLESAQQMLAARRWAEAEEVLNKVLAQDPGHAEAQLALARSLLGQGEGARAAAILEDLLTNAMTLSRAEQLMPVAHFLELVADAKETAALELTPVEAQYRQAALLLARGKLAPALDGLLEVLRHNKRYREGKAKDAIVGIIALLDDSDPLKNEYRRELASVLF